MKSVAIFAAILALLVVAAYAAQVQPVAEDLARATYQAWKLQHSKSYASVEEDEHRFGVFRANLEHIRQHNAAGHSYSLKMNQFGDLTLAEFKTMYLGTQRPVKTGARTVHKSTVAAPDAQDWRKSGAVTPVKNQGQCGSCWAFSTTGSLEGAYVLQGKKTLTSFSEQELVDCSGAQGNQGCNGGLMDQAFTYVQKNGLTSEADYKYKAVDEKCKSPLPARVIEPGQVTKFVDVTPNQDSELMNAVGTVGPVSVAINAASMSFQFYSHGVFNDKSCPSGSDDLDHGVLVVGYDTYQGSTYWIVKNSWGGSWGNEGYIWMARGASTNMCGILDDPSYPGF